MSDENKSKVIWTAQAGSQVAFLSCPIYEVLLHGCRGGGKTDALILDFLKDVGMGYGRDWSGILMRRTFPELEDVINKCHKLFPTLAPGAKYNSAKHEWRFPDGEVLFLRFIDQEKDYHKYHGHSFSWMGWEELCTWASLNVYLKMQSCMRSANPEVAKKIRIRCTANPLGPGHGAVKRRFKILEGENVKIITEINEETGNTTQRCHIKSRLEENKILLKSDPYYIDKLYAACKGNEAYIKSWIHGSWDIIAGALISDIWEPKYHVVRDFAIPLNWKVVRSFDWGSTAPFSVGWWAESDGEDYIGADGKVKSTIRGDKFRIAEWYGCTEKPNEGLGLTSSQVAEGIIERELALGIYHRCNDGIADPAIFASHDGASTADRMNGWFKLDDGQTYKGPSFMKADNARVAGWEALRDALRNSVPNADGMREHPGMFVFSTCVKCLELLPVLQRSEKKPDDVDTDTEDHLGDEVRYYIKGARPVTKATGRIARGTEFPYRVGRAPAGRVKQR